MELINMAVALSKTCSLIVSIMQAWERLRRAGLYHEKLYILWDKYGAVMDSQKAWLCPLPPNYL